MSFSVQPLPYEKSALEPHLSRDILEFHYEKHHKGYAVKLNDIAKNDEKVAKKSLTEIVKTESGKTFNMAAQIWNHDFYWQSMAPNAGGEPTGKIADAIKESFGSFEEFKKKWETAGANHFGSGWVWLVRDESNKLEIKEGHDASNPLTEGKIPVLVVDVWEHAFYLDYKSNKAGYLEKWWNLVNWEFANKNLV
ncbi:superoxide dismutase [Acrasis kona]|uniref:Superoxide dismutase n=1 Tax=Acrasis kona TaxID=1008807 RepID=A0AAW2YZF0_9EUKA